MGTSPNNNGVSIGDDMLVEILTRLPLKSFSRAKCVSKSCHGLISDDFVRNKQPLIVSGVCRCSSPEFKDDPTYISNIDANFESIDLGFLPFGSSSTLIDCCNGLLLFCSSLTSLFHVCNPTTKKYATLPKPRKKSELSVLVFDQYHSRHFKVVNFIGWLPRDVELELYDSISGDWAEHKVHLGLDTDALSTTMQYSGGILYILARPKQMVAIDLVLMTCCIIELPEATKNGCCVGKLGGRLHYSVSDGNQLRVWVCKGEEWVLKHCVRIQMVGRFVVVGFNPEKEVVYMRVGEKLVSYDLYKKKVEEDWELGKEKGHHLIQVWAFPFGKNLEDCLANVEK